MEDLRRPSASILAIEMARIEDVEGPKGLTKYAFASCKFRLRPQINQDPELMWTLLRSEKQGESLKQPTRGEARGLENASFTKGIPRFYDNAVFQECGLLIDLKLLV